MQLGSMRRGTSIGVDAMGNDICVTDVLRVNKQQ